MIWTQLVPACSAANSARTPRCAITFPTDESGIHPEKKTKTEVCAAEIINDLDRDGAVITDCGASQGPLWKQYTSCHFCGVPARAENNPTTTERETSKGKHGLLFLGSGEAKSKQLSWVSRVEHLWERQPCCETT